MSINISIEQSQLKAMVKEIILELFSNNKKEFIDHLTKAEIINNEDIDLEESANLYAEIYRESEDLQELTESALWDLK
jgi:antitoxin ParD1/3/4